MTSADPPPRPDDGRGRRVRDRIGAVRGRVRGVPGGFVLWRVGVTLVGVAVIVIGVVLLPLPGPGWLIIFAGLGLLATEYRWAADLLRWVRRRVSDWTRWVASRPRWLQLVSSVVTLIVLAAIVVGSWLLYRSR